MKILLTGAAGFIGFHATRKWLAAGHQVVGLDSINDYYDTDLKYARLAECGVEKDKIKKGIILNSAKFTNYGFIQMELENRQAVADLFAEQKFNRICHLAAQAGVRYSLENPYAYIDSNIVGFMNILEACRRNRVEHLVYASSSSVYGLNQAMPFAVKDNVDHPVSLYAASKKSNELMAHSYSHLYGLPTTGLRFFTVYGPWGRPDMALFIFTRKILNGEPIQVFNRGNMERDFTYVDDIVEGLTRVLAQAPQGDPGWSAASPNPAASSAPYRLYNIGSHAPVKLLDFIGAIEEALGQKAAKQLLPMQAGDVPATYADVSGLAADFDYKPATPIAKGVARFIKWYKEYYKA